MSKAKQSKKSNTTVNAAKKTGLFTVETLGLAANAACTGVFYGAIVGGVTYAVRKINE